MSRQFLTPEVGFINDTSNQESLIPEAGFLNFTSEGQVQIVLTRDWPPPAKETVWQTQPGKRKFPL